ncbi:helix-turn-helix domain-containing protein [Gulosibacter sediminis]|uniref:helix-turn-helix domain-containing protein n=1 Tax=Gulosibacter sediminis TaxID=1729695 RepID=UPI0031F69AC5
MCEYEVEPSPELALDCSCFRCSWFESRYPSHESLEFPRQSGFLLPLANGLKWPLVTRLVTKNPRKARFSALLTDEVRTRPHPFAVVRAAHLTGVEAHVQTRIEPAFLTQAEVAVLLGVPERTLEGWRLTKSGPPWLKLGRHVKYDREDVLAWAREQRHG